MFWWEIYVTEVRKEHYEFLKTFNCEREFNNFCIEFYGEQRWYDFLLQHHKLTVNCVCDELIIEYSRQEGV